MYVYGISNMLWLEPSVFGLVAVAPYYWCFLSLIYAQMFMSPGSSMPLCWSLPTWTEGRRSSPHGRGEGHTWGARDMCAAIQKDGLSSGRWSSFVRISVAAMQCCFLWGHFQPMSSSASLLNFSVHPAKKSLFYSYYASTTEKWIGRRSSEIVVKEQL